jgi:hypothetical protein
LLGQGLDLKVGSAAAGWEGAAARVPAGLVGWPPCVARRSFDL